MGGRGGGRGKGVREELSLNAEAAKNNLYIFISKAGEAIIMHVQSHA